MKRIITLTLALSYLFSSFSCQKAPFLVVSGETYTYSFTEDGGTQILSFSCNRDWMISMSESWIHVSPSFGSASDSEITIILNCDVNTTYESRKASLSIISEDLIETINIYQDANKGILVSPTNINLTSEAQSVEIEVRQNVEYTITIDDSCQYWIKQVNTKSLSTDTIIFNVSANSSYDDREGTIHFVQENGASTDVKIIQKQWDAFFSITPQSTTFSYKEQLFEIKSLTNIDFEVFVDAEWITYIETRGLAESGIVLSIDENPTHEKRSCNVILKKDSFEYTFYISQYGQPIDLSHAGTANCYIVPLDDSFFCFDASVAGNDISHQYYNIEGGTKASIVWEKSNDNFFYSLIEDLEYEPESRQIFFRTNQHEGNALIALLDEENTILWSWHIWLTNYNPNVNYTTFSNGAILQDRYLGAFSDEGIGLYYQWGRKDPFAPSKYTKITPDIDTGSVEYSISHPNIFMSNNYDLTDWDWNYEHTARWSSTKTVHDPCPAGWKVMDANVFYIPLDGYGVEFQEYYYILDEPICSPRTKFHATGLLHSSGEIQWSSESARMWANYGSYYDFYIGLEVGLDKKGFFDLMVGRAYGQNVRCQRE